MQETATSATPLGMDLLRECRHASEAVFFVVVFDQTLASIFIFLFFVFYFLFFIFCLSCVVSLAVAVHGFRLLGDPLLRRRIKQSKPQQDLNQRLQTRRVTVGQTAKV